MQIDLNICGETLFDQAHGQIFRHVCKSPNLILPSHQSPEIYAKLTSKDPWFP